MHSDLEVDVGLLSVTALMRAGLGIGFDGRNADINKQNRLKNEEDCVMWKSMNE